MSRLLLVAHGSSARSLDAHPLHFHAQALRDLGWVSVKVAFLRGEPSLRAVAAACDEPTIVVPAFMARGHFVERILPVELGHPTLTVGQRTPDGLLALAPPAGEQAILAEVARAAVADALINEPPQAWRVVLVGHGTPQHPHSGDTVQHAAALIRKALGVTVAVGFLDQEPSIESIIAADDDRDIIVLPWLAGGGGHAEQDIPERTQRPQVRVLRLPPVGEHPAFARALEQAALAII